MKLLTWLRSLLRRPVPMLPTPAPTAAPLALSPSTRAWLLAPLGQAAVQPTAALPVLLQPPTEAERTARWQAWQPELERRLAIGLTWENTKMLTPVLHRLVLELNYWRDELAEARTKGWVADELALGLTVQRLEAEIQLQAWQQSLIIDHGEEVGRKLGQHEVEVGMSAKQLFASYGEPAAGSIHYAADEPGRWFVRYGNETTGSYFELLDGVVTLAVLGRAELPAHVLNSPPVGEWPIT